MIQRHHLLLINLKSMVIKGKNMEIESGPTMLPKQ
jgi:hypothetical protein